MTSLLTEHTPKCLKVEYLDRIEYDFQKSCVTGPWDHKNSVSAKKVKKKQFHACAPLRKHLQVSAPFRKIYKFLILVAPPHQKIL
jgi:hypothetical protein